MRHRSDEQGVDARDSSPGTDRGATGPAPAAATAAAEAAGAVRAEHAPGAGAVLTIALRELGEHVRSVRFLVVAVLVLGLTPLAVYVGVRDYEARIEEYARLASARQAMAAGPAGERIAGVEGQELAVLRVVRPPEPLSLLVRGIDGSLPVYWDFTPIGTVPGHTADRALRLADIVGRLDLGFLVLVVLGLLAIILAFDGIAGEKEAGTLRMVLSHAVARRDFVAGKLLGGGAALVVPLAATVLLAVLVAGLLGGEVLTRTLAPKVALFAAASALYLVAWFAAGLFVSSLCSNQKTALVVLLIGWVVAVLAVPPVSTLVAQAVSPIPTDTAVETRKRLLDREIRQEVQLAMGAVYREVTGLPTGHANPFAFREHEEEMRSRLAPLVVSYLTERRRLLTEIDRDAERRRSRQERIALAIAGVSPAAVFAGLSADLASTGDAHAAAWVAAVRRHQGRLDEALFEQPPVMVIDNEGARLFAELRDLPSLAELPAFSPPPADAAAAAARSFPLLALLLFYAALLVAAAFVAFNRYDVR